MSGNDQQRIQLIDALRGIAVVLMVAHHFLYDLVVFLSAPRWFFWNPVFIFLHYIFAGLFILLSGVSSRFSRSNIKRGAKVFLIALAITLITWLIDMPVRFGVLHLLGFCMIFYGLTGKLWDTLPRIFALIIFALLLICTAAAVKYIPINVRWLWMFGWTYEGFISYDYFPIFPWLFVFLAGTVLGAYIRENRFPKWFYEKSLPFFPSVGRRALLIYILHQPALYGIVNLIKLIADK